MSALADIRAALAGRGSIPQGTKRVVRIGKEALRAVCVDTHDHVQPDWIDGAAVELTEAFPGWEIVDRAETRAPLFKIGRHG